MRLVDIGKDCRTASFTLTALAKCAALGAK
jgi:hypothetical protein